MHTIELGLTDPGLQEDLGYLRLLLEVNDLPISPEEEEELVDAPQVTRKEVRAGQDWGPSNRLPPSSPALHM